MPINLLKVQKKNGKPLYLQLKEQILNQIIDGTLESGEKLPTERELSEILGISRNTVSAAYKVLEKEGFITSRQGSGTFIMYHDSKMKLAENYIANCIEYVTQLGFNLDDYQSINNKVIKEFRISKTKIKAVFIECNNEQLEFFCNELEKDFEIKVHPIILDDLLDNPDNFKDIINSSDIVITTFFHINEVEKILPKEKQIIGIALDPKIDTMVKIAQIPNGTKIGLLCKSKNFIDKVIQSMKNAGLKIPDVYSTTNDIKQIEKIFEDTKTIISSPGRKKDLSIFDSKNIIEFIFIPDSGSLNLLKNTFYKIKKEKEGKE